MTLTRSQGPGSGAPLKILYVEDNSVNFRLVGMVFEGHSDVELVGATTVREGLELAQSGKPDLILLDLHLPDGSGTEILATLRADASISQTPIVALSADARPDRIEEITAAGADGYLTKPIEIAKLLELVAGFRDDVADRA